MTYNSKKYNSKSLWVKQENEEKNKTEVNLINLYNQGHTVLYLLGFTQ